MRIQDLAEKQYADHICDAAEFSPTILSADYQYTCTEVSPAHFLQFRHTLLYLDLPKLYAWQRADLLPTESTFRVSLLIFRDLPN